MSLARDLLRHPRRLLLAANSPRYWSPAVLADLLEEARGLRSNDPHEAFAICGMAVSVGQALGGDFHRRALTEAGNVARIQNRFSRSRQLLAQAESIPTSDRVLLLDFHSYHAGLDEGVRRFADADLHLQVALALAETRRERSRLLIQQGILRRYENNPAAAIGALREAMTLLTREDRSLQVSASMACAAALVDAGYPEHGRVMLERSGPLLRELGALDDTKVRWLQGYISASSGQLSAAACAYLEVRERLLKSGLAYEAALATLELALVLIQSGEPLAARSLISEVGASLGALGIPREARVVGLLDRLVQSRVPDRPAVQLAINDLRRNHHERDAEAA